MKIPKNSLDNWDIPAGQARQIQLEIAEKIVYKSSFKSLDAVKSVGGITVRFINKKNMVISYICCSYPDIHVIESLCLIKKVGRMMPYLPEYLSFGLMPAFLAAFKKIRHKPDILMCGEPGVAHPRRAGPATHAGVLLNMPVIGCALSPSYGTYEEPPPGIDGAYTFLKDPSGEIIGVVLRTRKYRKPLVISIGNKIGLDQAGDVVMGCIRSSRIPEPLRLSYEGGKQ